MALTIADFPHHLCVQHLDDVCAASPAMSQAVEKFYETYREVCQEVGVELADPNDPDKAFPPTTNGMATVLKHFCLMNWVKLG